MDVSSLAQPPAFPLHPIAIIIAAVLGLIASTLAAYFSYLANALSRDLQEKLTRVQEELQHSLKSRDQRWNLAQYYGDFAGALDEYFWVLNARDSALYDVLANVQNPSSEVLAERRERLSRLEDRYLEAEVSLSKAFWRVRANEPSKDHVGRLDQEFTRFNLEVAAYMKQCASSHEAIKHGFSRGTASFPDWLRERTTALASGEA